MDLDAFDSLGLPKNQLDAYLHLLKNGASKGAEIAKQMNISRPHVYDALNSLVKFGLASYSIKNGSRYYLAASPERLIDMLQLKKDQLAEKETKIHELIPELLSMQNQASQPIRVEVFEGKEGARTVFNDANNQTIQTKKEMVLFGAVSGIFRDLDQIFHKKHYMERERYGIRARYIFSEGAKVIKHPLIKLRVLPTKFKMPAVTWIFGNKVSIWMLSKSQWLCCVIENEALADSYREYFNFLWGQAKPT